MEANCTQHGWENNTKFVRPPLSNHRQTVFLRQASTMKYMSKIRGKVCIACSNWQPSLSVHANRSSFRRPHFCPLVCEKRGLTQERACRKQHMHCLPAALLAEIASLWSHVHSAITLVTRAQCHHSGHTCTMPSLWSHVHSAITLVTRAQCHREPVL
eukprot:365205-Chlamydomonas_euryale.AAC.3